MKNIFRYYIDGPPTIDIKIAADNKDEAAKVVLEYIENSPNYNINCFDSKKIIENITKYKLNKSEILSDESTQHTLNGHFD